MLPPFKMPAYSKPYFHYTWSEFISTGFSELWERLTILFNNAVKGQPRRPGSLHQLIVKRFFVNTGKRSDEDMLMAGYAGFVRNAGKLFGSGKNLILI